MDPSWQIITDILILLVAALFLGTVAEQLRQSAILGYLLAGTIVGPNVLRLVGSSREVNDVQVVADLGEVQVIAELGVALLLFTIGLEFSIQRLRRLGAVALVGGSLQVVITLLAAAAVAGLVAFGARAALAVGAIVALSSTACVLRVLLDRAALESVYGRNALGVLLLQDVAVIPLVLLMTVLSDRPTGGGTLVLLRTMGLAVLLVGMFYLLFNCLVPRLLNIQQWVKNRELPILLAIVVALGAMVAANQVGISSALGAFIAGVLLGGSPFAVQIRADVSSVRTLLVTVFFASIGLLGDPQWVMERWPLVAGTVAAIVVGKVVIVTGVMRLLRLSVGQAVATGFCLAQVGEFSFVLARIAKDGKIVNDQIFQLIVSAMIVTLFMTPFLVTAAPYAATWTEARRGRRSRGRSGFVSVSAECEAAPGQASAAGAPGSSTDETGDTKDRKDGIFVIGFGPAGQCVAQALLSQHRRQIAVIELNSRNIAIAQGLGVTTLLGDASHRDVLEHAQIHDAAAIIVTVPDPSTSRTIIHHCKYLAPNAAIIARSRYHVLRWELQMAGATEVVDEEEHVGLRLAAEARKHVRFDSEERETQPG